MRALASSIGVLLLGSPGCVPDEFSYRDAPASSGGGSGAAGSGAGGSAGADGCSRQECVGDAAPCDETWRTALGEGQAASLLVTGERVVAGGRFSDNGRGPLASASAVEACAGGVLGAVAIDSRVLSTTVGLAELDGSLYAAATGPEGGAVVRLQASSLERHWALPLEDAALFELASGEDGVWAVGATATEPSRALAIKLFADRSLCRVEVASPAVARAAVASGGELFVAGDRDGSVIVWSLPDRHCRAPVCECGPGRTSVALLPAGLNAGEARAIAVSGDTLFVAGEAKNAAGAAVGFVRAIASSDTTPGGWIVTGESVLALAADGERVFAAGGGEAPAGGGFIARLPDLLESDASFVWRRELAGGPAVAALAAGDGADGGLFLGGMTESGLIRCTKDGRCP
jgi:hypothetical protein